MADIEKLKGNILDKMATALSAINRYSNSSVDANTAKAVKDLTIAYKCLNDEKERLKDGN